MSEVEAGTAARKPRTRRWAALLAAGLVGAVAGGTLFSVSRAFASGGHWGQGGHLFGHHRGFEGDPEEMRAHLDFAVGWLLRNVKASEEQQQQVKAALGGAIEPLSAAARAHRENREAFTAELRKAEIDRDALERIRKSEMELAEEASRRFVQAPPTPPMP